MTADSKVDQPAIEQLIAAFYETGRPSELLGELLRDAVLVAVRKISTYRIDIKRQVKSEAPGHIWLKLSKNKKLFLVEQRFQPWCNKVVQNIAHDIKRAAKRMSPESGIGPSDTDGPGVVEVGSARLGEDAAKVMDDAAARREIARDFEQSVPAAIDRIIFAARFEYLDSVSDDSLREWCRAAGKPDLSAELREIDKAPRKRRYQMLAALMQLKDATVRQRACRAKKLLQARFPDCGATE